jgi:hypothetical protein
VYVQEFVGAGEDAKGKFRIPFQPPLDGHDAEWILKGALNSTATDPFNRWLVELSVAARNYNASLYRLRRLHLIAEHNRYIMRALPTDPQTVPDEHELPGAVGAAETDWDRNVTILREIIDGFRPDAVVDMVQVNGYIVSIRAIADLGFDEKIGIKQPAGSSSSHWSLSSPFSSSSSSSSSSGNSAVARAAR